MSIGSRLHLHFGVHRKLPLLLQTEIAECGLACLGMIVGYYGQHTDLISLRHRFPTSLKGATLAHLIKIADALKLAARPLRLELTDLGQLQTPCLLHWDFNHFVVLKHAGRQWVTVHDPALGLRKLSYPVVSKHFTGVALELTPIPGFRQELPRAQVSLSSLFGKVQGLWRSLGQTLLLALALETFTLVMPLLLQWVVDGVIVSADRDLLTTLGLGFLLLMLLQQAIAALRSWVVLYVSTTLNAQWMANTYSHLLRLPVAFFEKRHLGDILSRFGSLEQIQRVLTTGFVEGIIDGLMAVVMLVVMLIYSPRLTAISVATVLTYGLIRWLWYRPLRTAAEEQIVHTARQQSHFLETMRGVSSIKLFNRQDTRRATWLNLVTEQFNANIATQKLTLVYRFLNGLLLGGERIAIIWLGALLVLDSVFSVGMLLTFVSYKDQFANRVSGLIDKIVQIKMLRIQGERLADIVFTQPEEEQGVRTRQELANPEDADVTIELRDIRFRYSDNEPFVLDGCSLSINSGESVAIVGRSGCGKTTLLKVMLGLFPPSEGEILLGGIPLQQLGIHHLREMVGTVMQDDCLFAGSIVENIAFFDPAADLEAVEACARLACIHNDILALPMAYNTLIGDMGTALSGGQRQRILLARALYKKPRILFLDEATSHLDVELERAVNAGIHEMKMTRVIVAHRPETIASADRVIALQQGKVIRDVASASQTNRSAPNRAEV